MRVGIEVGGTFTDLMLLADDGRIVATTKVLSTPDNPARGVLAALDEVIHLAGDDLTLLHGSTVATNAVLERKGACTGLLTTAGFADILDLQRQDRERIYELQYRKPQPLVPREMVREINERVTAGGEVLREIERTAAAQAIEELIAAGVDAIAVCLLHSYAHPRHEQELRDLIGDLHPGIQVSISSEVAAEFREYERASTTVIDAFVKPVIHTYLLELQDAAARRGVSRVLMMQSNGGLLPAGYIRDHPARTLFSGPAAGVTGAVRVAQAAGIENIITLDMGGTSADVSLIDSDELTITYERTVADFPVRMPSVDIHTVGAGGGSIAWIDLDGLLKVGPYSAGAEPGPACYGRGGTEPTVTDANLYLGRLPGTGLLNGRMTLDRDLAEKAISELAARLSVTPREAALGILGVVSANMVRAIRVISVEKGHDPRDYALLAFGGAGPLHASDVARALGIDEVIIPSAPGILCAQGLVVSDQKEDFVRTLSLTLSDDSLAAVRACFEELLAAAGHWFERERIPPARRYLLPRFDMRHKGQNFELPITLPRRNAAEGVDIEDTETLAVAFHEMHERSYGFHNAQDPIEIVNLRLTAIAEGEIDLVVRAERPNGSTPEPFDVRPVVFGGEELDTPIYNRDSLSPGVEIPGPAIIVQLDTTSVLAPGDRARLDEALNLIMKVAP